MELIQKSWENLDHNSLYDILALRAIVFITEQDCTYVDMDGLDKISEHIYLKDGDKIVSYLRVIKGEDYFRIGRVVTDADYRGKGAASQLMNKAMEWIKKQGKSWPIHLSAQSHLEHFYARWGFEPIGELYMDVGIEHQDMIF